MGKLQQELLTAAQTITKDFLLGHPIFAPYREELTIILSGSAAAPYADRYSGVDLVILGGEEAITAIRRQLAAGNVRFDRDGFAVLPDAAGSLGFRVMFTLRTFAEAERELAEYQDFAMVTYPQAPVVYDPQDRYATLVAGPVEYPEDVLVELLRRRYQGLRRRRASIAWNFRRGQPFVLLQNLASLLDHALSICFYLDGRPPVGRKWLLQEGLRTTTGRRLRPIIFTLFTNLGDVALLGGTLNIRQNRLYSLLSQLQDQLEEAIEEAGFTGVLRDSRQAGDEGSPEEGPVEEPLAEDVLAEEAMS
ncbi:MAG TPA: hypothetical protein VK008_02725 [Sphingobacteriaceae bacterium]|nr:hypothetical protein [Sphingobacteriaceae bacterium]